MYLPDLAVSDWNKERHPDKSATAGHAGTP
jgi:hypothetical protein